MKRLSSRSTFFNKRIYPVILFGFLGFFLYKGIVESSLDPGPRVIFLMIPVILGAFFYIMLKYDVLDLLDEVYDEKTFLVFKNKGKEIRVNLEDIKNVKYSRFAKRVTLSMRYKTEFGEELSFSLPTRWVPFQKNKDILELIERIDKASG